MRTILISALFLSVPVAASANLVERACLSSDRALGNAPLCSCIQQAADRTLTARDQRLAARFFRDPDRAQAVRMSNRPADRAFWERYRSFGDFAEVVCASN